jgi:hypothetical protein
LKLRLWEKLGRASKPEAQAKERLAAQSPSLALQVSIAHFPRKSAARNFKKRKRGFRRRLPSLALRVSVVTGIAMDFRGEGNEQKT